MKAYFNFTKSQKVGVLVVLGIIILQIAWLNSETRIQMISPFVVDESTYELIQNQKIDTPNKKKKHLISKFNPNTLGLNGWVNLGFSEKQAKSILKYRTKINGFKSKLDLKKVYVISGEKYIELEPFILLDTTKTGADKTFQNNQTKKKEKIIIVKQININLATIDDLIELNGVGDYTAKGILNYRTKLGGYHSISQLLEVNGVSEENYNKIKMNLLIITSDIVLLNVNTLSIPQLKKHPYITWSIAEAITRKRLLSKLTSLQFLIDDGVIIQEKLNNLLPYIQY